MPSSDGPKASDERWICWPDRSITERCIVGLCGKCTLPPYRRKIMYKEVKELARHEKIPIEKVNQGMLFRPVRKMTSRR